MRALSLGLTLLLALGSSLAAADLARVPLADGFQAPVGHNGKSYYKARGAQANGHLGEDWNGVSGGDTDLGDPIYATATGIVVFAQNWQLGWGNVVITRHAYWDGTAVRYVDALYGHLLDFNVQPGQLVRRGQMIGRMGNNSGMYDAHLHFEMRKNLNVGMYRSSFPRDGSVYWSPTDFIAANRSLLGGGRIASVPVNTFPSEAPPTLAGAREYTPPVPPTRATTVVVDGNLASRDARFPIPATGYAAATSRQPLRRVAPVQRADYKVSRFDDMRSLGYQ